MVSESPDTVRIVARLRSNFAVNHLRSAVRAAQSAHDVEHANAEAEFGAWFDELMQLVPVSIVMAGAALEASANELIQDILDGSAGLLPTKGCRELLNDLKNKRSGPLLSKYRRLALLFDKEPQIGHSAWQDAGHLVNFRNYFLHFKPEWDDEKPETQRNLANALRPKIGVSRAFAGNFQFPHGFMTYSCAKWSVQAVLEFSAEFASLLAVKDVFAVPWVDFTLN